MAKKRTQSGVVALALLPCLLAACGAAGEDAQLASLDVGDGRHAADPYEATNRELLESNLWTYDTMIAPGVEAYRWTLPEPVRAGFSNVIDNLAEPRIFINDLLQGEFERAAESLTRFAFNSTIGFAGLFDRASQMGIPRHDEDFGQTLAVYGVAPGPYLLLPLFGPSNPRDATARVVDMALDPGNWLLFPISVGANLVGTTVDRFARDPARLDTLRDTSVDFYTTLRGAWLQNRAYEIANGAPAAAPMDAAGPASTGLAGLDPLEEEEAYSTQSFIEEEASLEPSQGPLTGSLGRSGFSMLGF